MLTGIISDDAGVTNMSNDKLRIIQECHFQCWLSEYQYGLQNNKIGNSIYTMINHHIKMTTTHNHHHHHHYHDRMVKLQLQCQLKGYKHCTHFPGLGLECSTLTFLDATQGFWYFARSRTREIQVFPRNPAKFPKKREIPRNPPEIFPNTCWQNIFDTYLGN